MIALPVNRDRRAITGPPGIDVVLPAQLAALFVEGGNVGVEDLLLALRLHQPAGFDDHQPIIDQRRHGKPPLRGLAVKLFPERDFPERPAAGFVYCAENTSGAQGVHRRFIDCRCGAGTVAELFQEHLSQGVAPEFPGVGGVIAYQKIGAVSGKHGVEPIPGKGDAGKSRPYRHPPDLPGAFRRPGGQQVFRVGNAVAVFPAVLRPGVAVFIPGQQRLCA